MSFIDNGGSRHVCARRGIPAPHAIIGQPVPMRRRLVHCCFLWPKQGIECDRVCSGALHSPERSLEPLLSTRRSPDARHRISCEASTQSEASIEASMRSFTRSFTRSFNFELGTTRFRRLLLLSPTSHAFSSHPTLCTSSNKPMRCLQTHPPPSTHPPHPFPRVFRK